MLKQSLNKETLLIELFYLLKNGKNVPRRLNQLLEQILNGRILVNHDFYDYSNRIKTLKNVANRFVLALLFLTFMLTGALLSFSVQLAGVMWLCFAMALLVFIVLVVTLTK